MHVNLIPTRRPAEVSISVRAKVEQAPHTVYFPAWGTTGGRVRAQVTLRAVGRWLVCEPVGEVSGSVVRSVRGLLGNALPEDLVIDLRHATLVDHEGFAVAMRLYRVNRSLGGSVRIVGPPEGSYRVWPAAHFFDVPPMFATIEEATQ